MVFHCKKLAFARTLQYTMIMDINRIKSLATEIISIIDEHESKQKTPLAVLGLSNRAKKSLLRGNIEYVEQLKKLEYKDLLRMRGMGVKTANEIKGKVKLLGFDV